MNPEWRMEFLSLPQSAGAAIALAFLIGCGGGESDPSSPGSGGTPTPSAELIVTLGAVRAGTPIRSLLGVNAGPTPAGESSFDYTQVYRQAGVRAVRTHDFYGPLDMAVMYPDRSKNPALASSYDFTASDAVWRAITAGGFEPYVRLGDSYNDVKPPATPEERANWVKASVEVLRHYREGKWNGFTTQFTFTEIWNEPDNQKFWPAPRTRTEFFQLFQETATGLRQAFPGLKIGGPGLLPTSYKSPNGQAYPRDFLAYLQSHETLLDFLSWHMYSNDPADITGGAAFYAGLLSQYGQGSVEQHISEYNTDSESQVSQAEKLALRTGGKGATIMTAQWIAMQQAGIAQAFLYRGNDTSLNLPVFYGIFYADGRPKRVALAFSLWTELAVATSRIEASLAGGTGSGVYLLVGQGATGQVLLLVANTNSSSRTWSAGFGDGRSLSTYRATLKTVSDASEQVVALPSPGPVITLPAYAVQLLVLER